MEKLICFFVLLLKIMRLKEVIMVNHLAFFMSIKMHIKDYAVKLLILTWEVNIKINTIQELKKYGIILTTLTKVTSLLLKYHKL